jgi:hypothetical protein
MTVSETRDRAGDAVTAARDAASEAADQVRVGAATAAEAVPEMISMIRGGVDSVADRLPDALEAARSGAVATADSLREMPQPTLRVLAAASVGLGIGLYVAGAPRLVTLAAFTPALLAGLAVTINEPRLATKRR